jgi:hypothetical protein
LATQIFFDGKPIQIPGAYSQIKSGIKNPSLNLAYGNALVIDTGGFGFGWGGGSGVNGTLKQGKDSVYTFNNVRDFRSFVRGGGWWLLSGKMFLPGGGATAGISSLTYVRAASTIPAAITIGFGEQASDVSNNGQIVVTLKDEGWVGNAAMGDETRAQATVTVSNAGADGDVISILVAGKVVSTYTVQSGDTIALVVAGLAAGIIYNGLCNLVSSSATQVVFTAPAGTADTLNGVPPTVSVTGTVAGTGSSAFAGGAEGTLLTRGVAAKIIRGVSDTSKYILQFWKGTFKGNDSKISDGRPYDGVAELDCAPELIVQSPEVDTVQELVTWMDDTNGKGYQFGLYFVKTSATLAPVTDEIVDEDMVGYIKAAGGSETFNSANLTNVLESLSGNYDFILADRWGDEAMSTQNASILDWVTNTVKIKPDIYIGAGSTIGEFATSISNAVSYDSQYVTIVHGGAKITDVGGRTFKEYDSIYKAAVLLGREAGLEPQIPLTFKNIGIHGELHQLKDKEVNQGLDAGVLMTRLDNGTFEVIKGINTLQNNDFLVNPDGTTHSKQLARVIRQLNKEITINAKAQLLKKPNGANRNTVSPEDVKAWLEGYLNSKVATDTQDNLILSFSSITVGVVGDAYEITYVFTPNFEVSFLVFTGVIVDPA